ncbi:MAG: PEGA domain-containing protein [Candidatus Kerfeldbacteria bacterium]|nr:PEGA domain-containing protein [Candidatus Kerfeldbacteria bacterium]
MYTRFSLLSLAVAILLCLACKDKPTEPPKPTIGTLVVITDPAVANVYSNDQLLGQRTPLTINLVANQKYSIRISQWNYYHWQDSVSIAPGAIDTLRVTLIQAMIHPMVITSDPTGATVNFRNYLLQPTPFITWIDTGTVTIKLTHPDYADWDTAIHHTTGDTLKIHAIMRKLEGSLMITSEPPGAPIFVDNQDTYLTTPSVISGLLATTHHIRLSLPDYEDWTSNQTVIAFDTVMVAATLVHQTGMLDVWSIPEGAAILIDGVLTGSTTPARLSGIPTGEHTIRIIRDRYRSWETMVTIIANTTIGIGTNLNPTPATLTVTSPYGAGTVTLNGLPLGTTPIYVDSVSDGQYELIVQHPGRFPYVQSFAVTFGNSYSYHATADLCPDHRLIYTVGDTIFTIGLDGLNPLRWREDYSPGGQGLSWAPDGSALVYAGRNALMVLDAQGNVIGSYPDYVGQRSSDFSWSPDGQYVLFGRYWAGIFRLNPGTGEVIHLYRSKSATYDNCPVYLPDGQTISFVHHEWGYYGWLYLMNADGSNARDISGRFSTEYDENLSTVWLDDSLAVFKKMGNPAGLFSINLSELTDSTFAPLHQLSEKGFGPLFFTDDRTHYLTWFSGHQLTLGEPNDWNTQTILMQDVGIYWIDWSPDFSAVAVRAEQGLYWVSLSGKQNRILTLPSGVGSVQVQK